MQPPIDHRHAPIGTLLVTETSIAISCRIAVLFTVLPIKPVKTGAGSIPWNKRRNQDKRATYTVRVTSDFIITRNVTKLSCISRNKIKATNTSLRKNTSGGCYKNHGHHRSFHHMNTQDLHTMYSNKSK